MTMPSDRRMLTTEDYAAGVRAGDRAMLARAITLIESAHPQHMRQAQDLLQYLLEDGGADCTTAKPPVVRLGITGVPGVGKSTTIDQLGINLVEMGHKVAVLAIDPTSTRSGGAILGDKTRMTRLAADRNAFIRPSPTSGTLGGVAKKTREAMAIVEAAGFDVVIVETVGVGQSEVTVAGMVDFFLVLLLAGGGDDLQGIKRGIIEIADMIAINKADGSNLLPARRAQAIYQGALSIITQPLQTWTPPVLTISAQDNKGLDEVWSRILDHRQLMISTGQFAARRGEQAVEWMHALVQERLLSDLMSNADMAQRLRALEEDVRAGRRAPGHAVEELLSGPSATRTSATTS